MKILVLEERLSGETLRCCTPNTHKYIPVLIGTHFSNIKMAYLFLKNTLVRKKKYIYLFICIFVKILPWTASQNSSDEVGFCYVVEDSGKEGVKVKMFFEKSRYFILKLKFLLCFHN